MSLSVCVMQPYWIPYPGYFRLFAAADVFVVLDDVQFPRRGYVHRNRLINRNGDLDWLTLPLVKDSRSALISELVFREDAVEVMQSMRNRFPVLKDGFGIIDEDVSFLGGRLVPFLVKTLSKYAALLRLETELVLASDLPPRGSRDAQSRIIELVKQAGGMEYVNLPGGRELYDESEFRKHGVSLKFLPSWRGDYSSILQQTSPGADLEMLRTDILNQC